MNQPPAQTTKGLGLGPMELVAVSIAGIFLFISFILYLAGQIAGLLFKGHWPDTQFFSFPGVAINIVQHPGSPADAWPSSAEGQIPGPVPYYIVLLLLIVAGIFGWKYAKDFWHGTKRKDANNAQWARAKDIKSLIVPHAGIRGRLVLGRSNGKMIATEPRQSVIVMGPTQTGKTTGFAVPAILEWDGPVIAASVKNDLVKDTYKWRRTQGEVWLFDPTRSTGFDYEDVRAGWSPLSQAIDWGGARKVASWLCKANKAAGGGLSDGDFWFSAAEKMMSPYLFAAAVGGKDMATVLRWIDINEEREVLSILERAGVSEAKTAFEANMKRDERTKSSIFTTAETIIDAYNDPLVCESAANPTIFSSELLNGGKNTLYICAPSHEQDRLQAIFTALVSQMKSAAYELAGKQNRPVDPPLLICIDEAANIAPLADLDALASTAAGIGIQLVTVFQDMAQIEARYKERARTVVNNHRAKVILSGISDTGTLEYVSKLCGEEEIDQQSTSTSAQGERSTTDSTQQRTLASAAFLRRMKFGEGIVVYGQLSPAKLVLRQWFNDRVLKHMVEHGTKPGVMGGPAGSNSMMDGSSITKDAGSIPAISAVTDTRMMDMPGNQMLTPHPGAPVTPGVPGAMTAPGVPAGVVPGAVPGAAPGAAPTEELSAFDKALAELRARDTTAPGSVPSAPTTPTTPMAPTSSAPGVPGGSSPAQYTPGVPLYGEPEPTSSPSKWKPSGGGVVEDTDSGGGGFAATPAPAPAVASAPATAPTGETSQSSDSKWSKGSRPKFVEAPPAVVPPTPVAPTPTVPVPTVPVAPTAPTVPTPSVPVSPTPTAPATPPSAATPPQYVLPPQTSDAVAPPQPTPTAPTPPAPIAPPVTPTPPTPPAPVAPPVSDLFSQYTEPVSPPESTNADANEDSVTSYDTASDPQESATSKSQKPKWK